MITKSNFPRTVNTSHAWCQNYYVMLTAFTYFRGSCLNFMKIWFMNYYIIHSEDDECLAHNIICQQARIDKPSLQTCLHPQPYKIDPQAVRSIPSPMLFPFRPHDWSWHNLPEPTNCLPPYPLLSCHKQDRIKMYGKMNTIGDKQVRHRLIQILSKLPHVTFLSHVSPQKVRTSAPKCSTCSMCLSPTSLKFDCIDSQNPAIKENPKS